MKFEHAAALANGRTAADLSAEAIAIATWLDESPITIPDGVMDPLSARMGCLEAAVLAAPILCGADAIAKVWAAIRGLRDGPLTDDAEAETRALEAVISWLQAA